MKRCFNCNGLIIPWINFFGKDILCSIKTLNGIEALPFCSKGCYETSVLIFNIQKEQLNKQKHDSKVNK